MRPNGKPDETAAGDIRKDVVVLGGGPAGSAIALALARRGYSVVVIERTDYKNTRLGETLPPAIRKALARLGVWGRFLGESHLPSFSIRSVWGSYDLHVNDLIFNPYGAGWHVDRARFDAMLGRAAEAAGASVYRGARLISCDENSTGGWWVVMEWDDRERSFKARVAVDATGRAALLARRQGARRVNYDHLVGIAGFYSRRSRKANPAQYTLVEAVDDGWWYSAMLPNCSIVAAYMTDADLYAAGSKCVVNYLRKQLRKAAQTASRLDGYTLESTPSIVAATSSQMDRIAGKNWLAVGDAAAAFDPLSSQGIQSALTSGLRAAQSVERYLNGDRVALPSYASWVNKNFAEYLLIRNRFYRRELRWPRSLFWQRRQIGMPASCGLPRSAYGALSNPAS